jgi:hypothetical protein
MKGKIAATWILAGTVCLASCGGTNTSQYTPPPSSAPDGLSYPDPNMFTQGVVINPLVPTLERGTATSYWVTPDLPPGLRLESDGRITGTPSAPKASATYLVTAGNSTGTASFGVRITVHGRFTIGGLVSGLTGTGLVLTNNGGDELAIPADGPFTFPTALPAASAFSVAVATQPAGQTCSVSAGSGFLTNDNYGQVAVSCSAVVQEVGLSGATFTEVVRALARDTSGAPQVACASSLLGDPLYEFEVDSAGAQVYTSRGIPLPGCAPDLVAMDPDGLWLSITNTAAQTVSVYTLQ